MSEIGHVTQKLPLPRELGLYVHVPFCASTCDFCAFYQERPDAQKVRSYLAGVEREAALVARAQPVTTLFWGGGTPGLLAADDLVRLGQTVRKWAGDEVREWTVELAPTSVTKERLEALRAVGVTRISMGVQSFDAQLLQALNRRHGPDQIYRAYERIRAAGFASVNLDLIFALPGQDEETWKAELDKAMALAPDHLSTYCLTFEEDTALWVKLAQGKVKLDTEREARLYERTWAWLEEGGYGQYEVSNFARPGHACLHNLNTWRMQEWVGLGPAAASQYQGRRGTNVADLDRWGEGVAQGVRATEDTVDLTPALLVEDALIFGLRLNAGVDVHELRRHYPEAPWAEVEGVLARLVEEQRAERAGAVIRLTLAGRLVADAVGSELLGAFSEMDER